jgi:hypothetical protein
MDGLREDSKFDETNIAPEKGVDGEEGRKGRESK